VTPLNRAVADILALREGGAATQQAQLPHAPAA
jgi:hypothetical protein